jgi:lipid-binding SYLF domain-containing protein
MKGTVMKKFLGVVCSLAMCAAAGAHAQDAQVTERLNHAADVLDQVMHTPDKGIPETVASGAHCVAVIPDLGKAAFVVGVTHGEGVVTCRTPRGWSAPVFIRLNGASFGPQIGGSATDLILIGMNHNSAEDLLKDKFKMGGDASVAAGPIGRSAQAQTDLTLSAEFLTYSRSKGVFIGVDLNGDSVSKNAEEMRKEYGANVSFESALHGEVPTPPNAQRFVHTVARYFAVSRDNH